MATDSIIPLHVRLSTEAEEIEHRLGVTRLPGLLREAAKALKLGAVVATVGGEACEHACRQAVEMIDAANGSLSPEQVRTIRRVLRGGVVLVEDASAAQLAHHALAPGNRLVAHG